MTSGGSIGARCRAVALGVLLAALAAGAAHAFQGPYASIVTGAGGFLLDLDVRWPTGTSPPGGWPVVFIGHGAGGNKLSFAALAGDYADDGYVSLTWTNRSTATDPTPETLATDIVALKNWLVNDFQAEAGVTVPVDPAHFGMTGSSLGGYTSWSGGLLSNAFATIVPYAWGLQFFADGVARDGTIDRLTGGPRAALLPTPYDSAGLDAGFDAVFANLLAARGTATIPVMTHMGMLDARTGGAYALADYEALTSAPARFLYLGTGGHGTPDSDNAFRRDLRDRWFAHFLKGEANGIDTEPPILVALLGTNEHLSYSSWPPPGQQTTTVWLRAPGTLAVGAPAGTAAAATIVNDPGSFTWANAVPNFPPTLIRNNLPRQVVAWQTAPLSDEALLMGTPSVRLELSGTGSRYQVNVSLFDQLDGADPLLLAGGSATLDHSPAVIDIPLSLTARRVPAGHRLRLEISNRGDQDVDYTDGYSPETDALRYIPFFELSDTSIHQDATRPSSLTLPLIGRGTLPLPGVACDPTPRAGCRLPTVPGKSILKVVDKTPDSSDGLVWKWSKGAATAFADFGAPLDTGAHVFCLYDGTAPPVPLLFEARAPAGDECGGRPCWKSVGPDADPRGWLYVDKDRTPDGLKKLKLLAGDAGKAKIGLSGKGDALGGSGGVPALPLPLPLIAQLQNTNACWEVTYTTAEDNGPTTFKAR